MERNESPIESVNIPGLVDAIIQTCVDPAWDENNNEANSKIAKELSEISTQSNEELSEAKGTEKRDDSVFFWKKTFVAMVAARYITDKPIEKTTQRIKFDIITRLRKGTNTPEDLSHDFYTAIDQVKTTLRSKLLNTIEEK